MKRNLFVFASLAVTPFAFAMNVLDFDTSSGGSGANNTQNVGWEFNLLEPIFLNGLSWYDEGGNGLSRSYEVGLWAPDGTLLASTTIQSGTGSALQGIWRVESVPQIALPAGNGYIVGGLNDSSSTDRLASNVTQTTIPQIDFVDATFSNFTSDFGRPTERSTAVSGFYGPSFTTAGPVPEPATMIALASGLGLLAARRRKRA